MAIAAPRRLCTCYLQTCRLDEDNRVAAQCVAIAALKAAMSVNTCASVQVAGLQQQSEGLIEKLGTKSASR